MTTHRIEADKVIVEDDRRVKQTTWGPTTRMSGTGTRSPSHNYSQPHKIIYVPVEPQPHKDTQDIEKFPDGLGSWVSRSGYDGGILDRWVAPHPDDTLILMEEWGEDNEGEFLLSKVRGSDRAKKYIKHFFGKHLENMPDRLGQQYKVVKVLGVEQLPDHVFEEKKDWPWNFKLLSNYLEV